MIIIIETSQKLLYKCVFLYKMRFEQKNQLFKLIFHLPNQFAMLWLTKQSRKQKISSSWKKGKEMPWIVIWRELETLILDFQTKLDKKYLNRWFQYLKVWFSEDLKKTFSPYQLKKYPIFWNYKTDHFELGTVTCTVILA